MFPMTYQPRLDVGGITVSSQDELDALIKSGWPDSAFTKPQMSDEEIEEIEEAALAESDD